MKIWYWIDEGLTVGLASQPVTELPSLLRLDGSPPLYYLLLHGWIRLFGPSELATHALSLVIASAAVPVAYWAGRGIFDRRTGWMAATLAATSPFLTFFARETRMYTLVVVLAMLVSATFLRVFVHGDRRLLAGFVLSLTALLYTHNWGLYLGAACLVALVPAAVASGSPATTARRGLTALGVVGIAYLPWTVVLISQVAETGAPWAYTPNAREVVGEVAALLRDERVLLLLVAVVAGALLPMLRRPQTSDGAGAWVLTVLSTVPLGLGWALAHVEPSWATRYLAVVVGPMLLLLGLGLARAGASGAIALALAVGLWIQPFTRLDGGLQVPAAGKSDARSLAETLEPTIRAGDLVVVAQPEAVPLFAHYLGGEVRYATLWGEVERPLVMDWRNAPARLRASSVERHLRPLVESLAPGARLVLVGPGAPVVRTDTDWIRRFHRVHSLWRQTLSRQAGVELLGRLRADSDVRGAVPFVATVFEVEGGGERRDRTVFESTVLATQRETPSLMDARTGP